MLPRGIGDEVTAPTVSQFMCNNIDVFTILKMSTSCHQGLYQGIGHTLEMILGVAKVKMGFSMPP
jgi:hypothetical protein